ncbi:16S rRNA (cytosine(1402)-N(4))-methyltransferase RsmH [Buchnera aphidicola]|uniref:16S rRNA (cytosine(1402)-N(4))-methyltransferase RsmH n=1 Tax=Buchnera aphidicola TaxID=9 RepID=UPI00346415A7
MNTKLHKSVLLKETIQSLNIKKNGTYIDGTFGSGGHSLNILNKLGPKGKLYAIDRDLEAVKIAKKISDPRFHIIHGNFSNIDLFFKKNKIKKKIDGIILDLGMSTMQLMSKNRGFSFKINGPLDMRMNQKQGISAAQWINSNNKKTIANILKTFGEERFAKKIAKKIELYKNIKPITTTEQLSKIIMKVKTKKNQKKHPATKSFQAIRIFINQELQELQIFLKKILNILNKKGRISIISFHSLEDKIVKQFMLKNSSINDIPMGIPISEKQIKNMYQKKIKIINRIFPNIIEILNNPKSRSAILRTAELQ